MSELPTADWNWIDATAGRFERAWKDGPRPRIEDFLAGASPRRRAALLGELLRVERELRQRLGEHPTLEEYHRRFPGLEAVVASVFQSGPAAAGRSSPLTASYDPPTSPENPLPAELADHPDYEIIRPLGKGGMGIVFLAHNRLMGRDEVLKVVGRHIAAQPGLLDRFLREIRAVARLRHPNIVSAYSAFRCGETLGFAMEYVEGLDLARLVKAKGPLPVANACNYVYQAALGLQHAHEVGLVHRDIKPGNLMLARQGNRAVIKLLDFGLAKASSEQKVLDLRGGPDLPGDGRGTLTGAGEMLGTPDFVAPEQIVDAQRADIRADIYSLGCTLYYLVSGRPPFQTTTHQNVLQAHQSTDAEPLDLVRPEVPAELAVLVAGMMAKEPAQRPQTPAEVARSLLPFFSRKVTASLATGHAAPQEAPRGAGPSSGDAAQPETQVDRALAPTPAAGSQDSITLPEAGGATTIPFGPQESGPPAGSKAGDDRRRFRRPLVLAVAGLAAISLGVAWLVAFQKGHHRSPFARRTDLVAVGPEGAPPTEPPIPPIPPIAKPIPGPLQTAEAKDPGGQPSSGTPTGPPPKANPPSAANPNQPVAAKVADPARNKDLDWSGSFYVVRAEREVRKRAEAFGKGVAEYQQAILAVQSLEQAMTKWQADQDVLTRQRQELSQQEGSLKAEADRLDGYRAVRRYWRDVMARNGQTFYLDAASGFGISVAGLDQEIAAVGGQIDQCQDRLKHIGSQFKDLASRLDQHSRTVPHKEIAAKQRAELDQRHIYLGALQALRESVEATKKQYGELAGDAGVKAELESKNRGLPQPKFAIGPSREFDEVEGKLRRHEDWAKASTAARGGPGDAKPAPPPAERLPPGF
jgi:serine/threonine protein kinase